MNQANIIKERIAELQARLPAPKAWGEGKRAGIQSDLLKELATDGNGKAVEPAQRKGSEDDAVLVEAGGPAGAQGGKKKKKKLQQQQQQQQAVQQPTPPAE